MLEDIDACISEHRRFAVGPTLAVAVVPPGRYRLSESTVSFPRS